MITRTVNIDAGWDCISSKGYISKPHHVKVSIKDTYDNIPSEDLSEWSHRVANEVTKMMCKRSCESLSDSVYCNDIFSNVGIANQFGKSADEIQEEVRKYKEQRDQELIKRQQKQQKTEQKRKANLEKEIEKAKARPIEEIKIPVTIDTKPTTITIKKDLTTMDIVQISRLQKSIDKLEKVRQEQEAFVNMYSERIKSERLDMLLSSTKQRDTWTDEMNRTIRKIEKQQKAIEKIKSGIS